MGTERKERVVEFFCEIALTVLIILCCIANLHQMVKKGKPASDAIIQICGTLTFLALVFGAGLYD
jgi:hypothetical protein